MVNKSVPRIRIQIYPIDQKHFSFLDSDPDISVRSKHFSFLDSDPYISVRSETF